MVGRCARNVHKHVDAVEQRPAQATAVARQLGFAANTAFALARISAWTWISRCQQHEARRVHGGVAGPHDRHLTILKRLT
jgi:hypothetical protein